MNLCERCRNEEALTFDHGRYLGVACSTEWLNHWLFDCDEELFENTHDVYMTGEMNALVRLKMEDGYFAEWFDYARKR